MDIRNTGQVLPGSVTPPQAADSNNAPQASMNITDSFKKSIAPGKPIDLNKISKLLLHTDVKAKAEVAWIKEISVNGSPLVGADGIIFASERYPRKALHAYDPATGTEMWKQNYGDGSSNDPGPQGPILGTDGSLIVAAEDNEIHQVDPATGKDKWSIHMEGFQSGITAYDDGRISFRSAGKLICLDMASHKIISQTPLNHDFESAPIVGKDGTVYGGGKDGYVYALEPNTGNEKWKYKTGDMIRNSPTVGPDGTVYVGSIDKTLHAINPATGEGKWKMPTSHWIIESPTVGPDGTVYVGNSDNYVYAVDPASGQYKWKFYCGAEIRVSPTPAKDGILYVVTDRNVVLGLDQESGGKVWQYQADSYIHCQPACDDKGNFYFGCNNGRLYAMKVPAVTERLKFAEEVKNGDLEASATPTIEKEEDFIVVDNVKLKVKKEKTTEGQEKTS